MSANRKLQTEVDRVLKKVEEGVEEFDDIFSKVYSVSQQSLKEKYESDLKKEIKKLQRLRDQIKSWLGNTDIKDKSALIEARKLIEVKMEEFKVCEKETKTKAFSKEGLAREEKLNPREVEREEKKVWIQTVVERIEGVVESLEAELERVSNLKGKGKNKDQMDKLEARITTNRWHISKLEQINRLLDNDVLEPSKLDSIKEELDYYLECIDNEDAIVGMESDEYNIYEELQLDLLSLGGPGFGKGEDDEEKEGDSKLGEELSPIIESLAADESSIPALTSVPSNSSSSTTTTTTSTTSTTSVNAAKSKKAATTTTTPSTNNSTSSASTPNVTLPTTNSSTSSSSTTATSTTTATAQNKLASVISSVGTKTAASVVANTSAQAKTVPTGAKSVVAPSTQKSAPTAASIVASNIPTNPSTVAGAKTQPTPALTAAKIVAGEKKVPTPTTTQAKPVENRKDPSGPTPTVTSPPLTGSWAHAATSGQRIGIGSGNSPSPKQTTPKQSTLSTPPVIPPVESLPQAVTQISETSSSTSTSANSKTNEVTTTTTTTNNNNNTSSSITTTTPATTTVTSINAPSNNNNNNNTSASSVTPSTTVSNSTPSTNVAVNNTTTAASTTVTSNSNNSNSTTTTATNNNNNNTNTTTASAAAVVASNSNNGGGVSNSSLQSKVSDSETQVVKPQVNSSPALNPKTTSSPVLNSVSNSNEPPSLTSLSLEDNNKGSNGGIPPLHKLTPIQQPQQSPATQPSVTLSPGPSQGLPPPHSNPKSANPSNYSENHNPQTIAILKQSMAHLPPNDFERKSYIPRTPYPGTLPPSFPTQPLSIVDNPVLFERLPMDTLFFAFYYQQGAHQQYLAARQLKKHSWRYHKKYMTWFQRHEEPKTTTSDYEEGTYVYFDYESGWCQRIKSEFKFEYAYLEDELPQAGAPSSKDSNNDRNQAGGVRYKNHS